jgi:hypothetical protein
VQRTARPARPPAHFRPRLVRPRLVRSPSLTCPRGEAAVRPLLVREAKPQSVPYLSGRRSRGRPRRPRPDAAPDRCAGRPPLNGMRLRCPEDRSRRGAQHRAASRLAADGRQRSTGGDARVSTRTHLASVVGSTARTSTEAHPPLPSPRCALNTATAQVCCHVSCQAHWRRLS